MVRVVSTIYGNDLLKQAKLAKKIGADMLEIRLDLLNSLNEKNILNTFENLKREVNLPIISTIRLKNEGGNFRENELVRLHLFKLILDVTDYIDMELRSTILDEILRIYKNDRVILSYHDFKSTPGVEKLIKIYKKAKKYNPWVIKIVTRTEKYSDLRKQVIFLEKCKNNKIAIFGMGPLGWISRIITSYFGTALIYGHLKHAVVDGQPPLSWLITHIRTQTM